MSSVKLAFLDRQKLTDNCSQTIEVVAVKSTLLLEEIDLVQCEILFYKTSIYTNINKVLIFTALMENTSQEYTSALLLDHLH